MTHQPSVPPATPTPRKLSVGDLLVLGGGLIVFAFSFAPFVQYGAELGRGARSEGISSWFNAWALETFMVPLTTFVIVAALLSIAAVVIRFVLRRDPRALGFRLRQIEVGLGLFVFVVLLGMVTSEKHAFFGARRLTDPETDPLLFAQSQMDVGWGAVLMLLGSIAVLAGALLNHFGIGATFAVGARPSTDAATDPGLGHAAPPPQQPPPPPGWQGTQPPPPHPGGPGEEPPSRGAAG